MLNAYVFAIMSPRNNKFNKVKLKGDPAFRLLTPVAKVT